MVSRVNGEIKQGYSFSKDVKILTIAATGGTFLEDLLLRDGVDTHTVNSGLEQVIRAVGTRATVIGINVVSATAVDVMVDYASAFTAGNTHGTADSVEAELKVLIDAISTPNLSASTVTTYAGFAGAAQGTAV